MRSLRWILLAVVLLGSLAIFAQDTTETTIIDLINQARATANVAPLIVNASLMQASQAHSDDMAVTNTLSHVGSNGSQFWERATQSGYVMITGAENVLSRSDTDAFAVFEQWRNSTAHNANMVNPQYQEVGLGYSQSASGTWYFTLLLGARADFVAPIATVLVPTSAPVMLPSNTPIGQVAIQLPTATAFDNTVPVSSPTPLVTTDPLILTLAAPQPTNTIAPLLPTITPNPLLTPTVIVATTTPIRPPDIRLFVSAERVTLQNVSGKPLDMTGLVFESETASLSATRWDNGFLSEPLDAFPDGDCLDVWGLDINKPLDKQSECQFRHGWISVNEQAQFWIETENIRVVNKGQIVGNCAINTNTLITCDISLSAPLANTATTPNNPATNPQGQASVRLLITEDSVALINQTGSPMDISNWQFVGESATLLASDWNTGSLSQPLSQLPNNDCLQVWGNETSILPKPSECQFRHGWIAVGENRRFWFGTSFTVKRGDTVLGTCATSTSVCDIRP